MYKASKTNYGEEVMAYTSNSTSVTSNSLLRAPTTENHKYYKFWEAASDTLQTLRMENQAKDMMIAVITQNEQKAKQSIAAFNKIT